MAELRSWAVLGVGVLGACAQLAACSSGKQEEPPSAGHTASLKAPQQSVQSAFPLAKVDAAIGRPTRVYGAALATGATAFDSADRFRSAQATSLGIPTSELVPQDFSQSRALAAAAPKPLGLMYDGKTGQYKFWLYRYGQVKGGVPVFRSGLLTLVKNQSNNPVVWASSFVHDLSTFTPPTSAQGAAADPDKSLKAIRGTTDMSGRTLPAPSRISRLSSSTPVIFAGKEGQTERPRLAFEYTAETANPAQTWRLVADAATGDVLHAENVVVFENVTGTVTALATQGTKAMDCADEVATGFPYAEVTGGGASTFANLAGNFELSDSASTPLDVISPSGGQYFDVTNAAGTTEQLLSTVTPPGPVSFVHNADNASDLLRAQANGYLSANQVRDFLLKYVPNYPVISTQLNFPVNVNRSDGFCPGNAWYDGSSINFCLGSTSYGNTAFASVAYHEYGHHIVASGGSGQGAYGEGMGDTVASLLAGDPGLGYGFFLNQCTTPLRTADNTCQYSATACSSCGSEAHDCGNLLSGTMWSIRKALAISQPETYADLINALVLSSVPLHIGEGVDSSIAVDLLTLDDDDANIDNGSPHYNEICAGFAAHGMSCPPLLTGLSVSPANTLGASGPVGGPFAPESVSYTLKNLGPAATISYSVSPLAAAPWLSIANASGQLALGQQAQVTVAINQTNAAALAKGNYQATVQFSNLTDGTGTTTRDAKLEVGVQTIFSENFSNGLGSFSLGTEAANRWHVTSSCASTSAGHSAPASLYFGIDSTCNYDAAAISAGTATSTPISVTNSSLLKLRFNYYLQTEHLSPYDKATVQVSVNGGAYSIVASNNAGGVPLLDGTGVWQASEVDLSSLIVGLPSATLQVQFGFDTGDSVANAFTGFLVDDVEVRGFATACTSNGQCDDGLFCNGSEQCQSGSCVAGTPLNCSDGVTCTQDACNEATKACTHQANNAACDDGQVCNGAEVCSVTLGCQSGAPLDCNDANACTADACDPTLGCQHTTVSCDDSNACTTDSCSTTLGCQHGTVSCDDSNVCTTDSCVTSTGCQHANNTSSCADDGNACTTDVCAAGACTHPDNGSCSLGAFLESGGQVVMEAEHFSLDTPRASHTWDLTSDSAASGGQCMLSNPNNGANVNTGYTTGSPQLNFPVKFTTTGTYQVWVRGLGAGSADRTVHAGLDGTGPTTSDRISGFSTAYAWSKSTLDGPVATINVTSAGVHTINLWMREDGFRVDRLLLTTNTGFVPSGAGPAESSRGQACTTSATCNDSNPCTQDSCVSGTCSNTAAPSGTTCADDGNSCTSDVCSGTTCTHPNNGSCGGAPCSGFCANPVTFNGALQSGNLGTGAVCYQTTATINGGNCGNFVSPRTLSVNGTLMSCNNGNWPSLPAKVNGGYCVTTTAGNQPWAYFTTW
jgi:Gylcosyl hydrolase family 115 C-terminal domain/Dictyostelium (slime mold) repeat